MSSGVDQPSEMQADHGSEENPPQNKLPTAYWKQYQSEHDHRHVVIFRDPDVKLVFGEIGNVTGECGCVVMHGLAHQDPAHVSPPLAIDRGMRVAFVIRILVMNAMRGHPENRSAFKGERGANCEEILDP